MITDDKLLKRGMRCLIDNLGVVEAQRFIVLVKAEKSDYTQWQREHYDNMTAEEFHAGLQEFMHNHPDDKHFCEGESTHEV